MTEYETIFIAQPDWSAEQVRQFCDRLTALIDRQGGVVFHAREVARRRMAYRVGKHTKGLYLYCNYGGGGRLVTELERTLRYEEGVLKFLTVKIGPVGSVEARRAKTLEEEARLVQLFGSSSEAAPIPTVGEHGETMTPSQAS